MPQNTADLRAGDILLHPSTSGQAPVIELATHSQYSHCGIFMRDSQGKEVVYEATQPVKKTSLGDWLSKSRTGHRVAYRLRDHPDGLSEQESSTLRQELESHLGVTYDGKFQWDDLRLYCSEYVWKAYREALGIEVCPQSRMRDFDFSHPKVRELILQRYGSRAAFEAQADTTVVPPSAFTTSPDLMRVWSTD